MKRCLQQRPGFRAGTPARPGEFQGQRDVLRPQLPRLCLCVSACCETNNHKVPAAKKLPSACRSGRSSAEDLAPSARRAPTLVGPCVPLRSLLQPELCRGSSSPARGRRARSRGHASHTLQVPPRAVSAVNPLAKANARRRGQGRPQHGASRETEGPRPGSRAAPCTASSRRVSSGFHAALSSRLSCLAESQPCCPVSGCPSGVRKTLACCFVDQAVFSWQVPWGGRAVPRAFHLSCGGRTAPAPRGRRPMGRDSACGPGRSGANLMQFEKLLAVVARGHVGQAAITGTGWGEIVTCPWTR